MPIHNKYIKNIYDVMHDNGLIESSEDEFSNDFFASGQKGYNYRKQLFDRLKYHGADIGNSYEDFAGRIGLRPKSSVVQKPKTSVSSSPATSSAPTAPSAPKVQDKSSLTTAASTAQASYNPAPSSAKPSSKPEPEESESNKESLFGRIRNKVNDVVEDPKVQLAAIRGLGNALMTAGNVNPAMALLGYGINDVAPNFTTKKEVVRDDEFEAKEKDYREKKAILEKEHKDAKRDIDAEYKDILDSLEQRDKAIDKSNEPTGVDALYRDKAQEDYWRREAAKSLMSRNNKDRLHQSRKALQTLEEAHIERNQKGSEGFIGAMGRRLKDFGEDIDDGDTSLFDFGVSEAKSYANVLSIVRKVNNGEELTPEEMKVMHVRALQQAVEDGHGDDIGYGYKAIGVTVESLPFMLEMAANPASGLGKAAVKTTAGKLVKKGVSRAVNRALGGYVGKKASVTAGRIATRVVGDAIGAAGMAATSGAARVAGDAERRMSGDVTYENADNGDVVYTGNVNQASAGTALFKAFGSVAIENHSEMLGDYFAPILGAVSRKAGKILDKVEVTGVGKKIHLKDARKFINDVKSSDMAKLIDDFQKQTHWDGVIGEYAEEVVGGIENALIVHDDKLTTDEGGVFNLERNIETFLGVGLMGGFMSAVKTLGYRTPHYRQMQDMKRQARDIENSVQNKEAWHEIRAGIDNESDEDTKAAITAALTDPSFSEDERRSILDYAKKSYQLRGSVAATASETEEKAAAGVADAQDDYNEGRAVAQSASPIDLYNAQREYDTAYEMMAVQLGDRMAEQVRGMEEEDLTEYVGEATGENGWSEEDIFALNQYASAKARLDGINDSVSERVQDRVDNAKAEMAKRTGDDGNVTSVTLKVGDRKVYVTGGNLVTFDDGSINAQESSQEITVYDPATWKTEMISPRDILSIDGTINADEELASASAAVEEEVAGPVRQGMEGGIDITTGTAIPSMKGVITVGEEVLDENGAPTGTYNVDVNGEAAVMSEDEMRSAYDELKARVDEERAVAAERGRSEREAARNEEEYRQQVRVGDDVTFVRDGKRISGRAVMDYDEDSLIVDVDDGARTRSYNVRREEIVAPGMAIEEEETPAVDDNAVQEDDVQTDTGYTPAHSQEQTETPGTTEETEAAETVAPAHADNGTTTSAPSTDDVAVGQETAAPAQTPAAQVHAEQQQQTPANRTTTAANGNVGTPAADTDTMQRESGNSTANVTATAANTPASAQDIVSDRNTPMPINEDTGEPDYARATPERTREFLYNESGLDADEADAYVENNSEQAREELDKAKNSKPKMEKGKTLTQFISEKAAWQQQMDEAQRNVDYWEGVKNAGQETAQGMAPAQNATHGAEPVAGGTEMQNVGQDTVAPSAPVAGNAVDAGEQRASLRRNSPVTGEQVDALSAAEAETNTEPTDAQKEAGNYKKGHVKIDGYDITIENQKGSVRRGTDADGKQWSVTMNNTYGYIRGTEGVDGDHIDIFLSDDPSNGNVFVIDQVNADGTFDEHKVMYGFASAEEARDNYLANYSEGWTGLGTISEVTKDEFKKWIGSSHRKTKPFADYKNVKVEGAQNEAKEASLRNGREEDNAEQEVPGDVSSKKRSMMERIAEKLGYRIEWHDTMDQNGLFDPKTKTIHIALDAENPLAAVFGHESMHRIAENAEDYKSILALAKEVLGEEEFERRVDDAEKRYRDAGYDKPRSYYEEEAVCDFMGEMLDNDSLLERVCWDANHRVLAAIRNVIDRILAAIGMADARLMHVRLTVSAAYNNAIRRAETEGEVPTKEGELRASLLRKHDVDRMSTEYHSGKKTGITKKVFDAAQKAMDAMYDMMMPYYEATALGKRMLPEERYGRKGAASTIFSNGSYGKTMENTLKCIRTLAYNEFTDDVKRALGRPLTQKESFLASQMVYDISSDPQCLYCYVSLDRKAYDEFLLRYMQQRDGVLGKFREMDAKKRAIGKTAPHTALPELYAEFLDKRKDTKQQQERFDMWIRNEIDGAETITAADLSTADVRSAVLEGLDASMARQVKDAEKYAQSASWAKKDVDYISYVGELLKLSPAWIKKLTGEYGLRFYSFSEYTPAFLLENMQMVRDAALRGLRGLGYTKELDFVKVFAPTGMNINCSCYGRMDSEGNMQMDTRQGADWEEVKRLRGQYRNVGAVFVATNDAAVEWALAQDWIDVVIPFHIVRTGQDIADFYGWSNYSKEQADSVVGSSKKMYISPVEHKNDKAAFLAACEKHGVTPRFSKWLDNPNYMKLVNETRLSVDESSDLQPVFDMDAAADSWKRFVNTGGYYNGWWNVDAEGYADAVRTVVEDIRSGKMANEVDYGRQDVPANVEKMVAASRKKRIHGNVPLVDVYDRSGNALSSGEQRASLRKQKAGSSESVATEAERAMRDAMNDGAEAIEDVGQKIGGARKDKAAEMKKRSAEMLKNSDESLADTISNMPVSKIFDFDFAKLRADGISNEIVSFIKACKDSIPAKPRAASRKARWVRDTLAIYRMCLISFNKWDDVSSLLNGKLSSSKFAQMYDAYMAVGGFDSGLELNGAYISQLGKNAIEFGKDGERISLSGKWYVSGASKYNGIYDTREAAADALKQYAGTNAVQKGKKPMEFAVYKRTSNGVYYITPKGKSDVTLQDGFKSYNEAFEYIRNHGTAMEERYRTLLSDTKIQLGENRERKGRDHRAGRNVGAQEFMETFGFRGVEFGNWTNQDDRASSINRCYDALMDLADVLGVSPKALSLNGTLGMAFGARGGGNFAAHFERDKMVINLTKTKGAGSLAHEWFHALDNYFAKMGGVEYGFATSKEGLRPNVFQIKSSKDAYSYYDRDSNGYISESEYRKRLSEHGVREEMADAWIALTKAIESSEYKKRSDRYAALHNSTYWTLPTELGARSFSKWVEEELSKRNSTNDYLANNPAIFYDTAEENAKKFAPYPFDTDSDWMENAFGNLFSTMQQKTDESTGNVVLYHKDDGSVESIILQEAALRDALNDVLTSAGIDVVTDVEEGQRVLDEVNGDEVREQKGYYDPRSSISPVRGKWTKEKIVRRLKDLRGAITGYKAAASRIAEFDSAEELADHMFYHGTQFGGGSLKPSILMSDSDIERIGGGGYGDKYWGVSVSRRKDIASRFSSGRSVRIYPIILVKNAKVKEMPNLDDAADLEDYIVDLWNEGVDAVWIGDKNKGEQELCVLNPRAIVNIDTADTYDYFKLGTEENPLHVIDNDGIKKLYDDAVRYVNARRNTPKKPLLPSRFYPGKEGEILGERKSDDVYEREFAEYKLRLDEYNNSEEAKRLNDEEEYARRNIRFFRTADGNAYGFTVNGKVYIDPRMVNAETPIHEYTHLWATAVRERKPKEWKNVVELMKGTDVWDDVVRTYPELKTDDAIADEVLAQYSGRRGAERLRREMDAVLKSDSGITEKAAAVMAINNVRAALNSFWRSVARMLGLRYTSAEDVADCVLRDMLNLEKPGEMKPNWKMPPRESLDYKSSDDELGYSLWAIKSGINPAKKYLMDFFLFPTEKYRTVFPTPTTEDYFLSTRTDFKTVPTDDVKGTWEEMKNSGKYEYTKSPLSNSEYLVDHETGDIYRMSDHWGPASSCYWTLDGFPGQRYTDETIAKSNIKDFDVWHNKKEKTVPRAFHMREYAREVEQSITNYRDVLAKVPMTDAHRARFERALGMLEDVQRRLEEGGYKPKKEDLKYQKDEDTIEDYDLYRTVEDEDTIEFLEGQPSVTTYRSMVLIDGKLYPPMSSKESGSKQLRNPSELGKWEEAEESPDKAYKKGNGWYFDLKKDNGKTVGGVAYNPYIHTSTTMLNDQFSEAQDRDNLVVVEMHVPESELTSRYQADKAKDSVGVKEWKAGIIQGMLSGTREVILTRWAKPVRIVPVEEVAENIAKMIEGKVEVMPSNVVTPQQRNALEDLGVEFVETDNKGKIKDGEDAGKTWSSVYGKKAKSARKKNDSPSRIKSAVEALCKKLNLDNVEILDDASGLEGKRKKAKGFYNRKTGKITIVLSNATSVSDAVQTLLHEAVAHYGLRKMFGAHFDTFLDNVFRSADESVRRKISELSRKHDFNIRTATEEYLASLAEDTNFEKENAGWWKKVKSMFMDMLRQIGFEGFGGVTLSDNELRYILWRSYKNLAEPGNGVFSQAEDVSKQNALKVGEFTQEEEVYRIGDDAVTAYHNQVNRSFRSRFREAWVDGMMSVKAAIDAIRSERNDVIEDFENPYLFENQMHGIIRVQSEVFQRRKFEPMVRKFNEILDTYGMSEEDLHKYLMAKHGLERNNVFAMREAERLFDEEKKKDANTTKSVMDFFSRKDYSGLTSLMGENQVSDAEIEAEIYVNSIEGQCGNDIDELWDLINDCTEWTLHHSYECGELSKEQYDNIRGMFKNYIPLRGWDGTNAQDVYDYIGSKSGVFSGMVKAKGRSSVADNPIAYIGNMAISQIVGGNRNRLKQHAYRMAQNHPTSLFEVGEQWYENIGDENNPNWIAVYPDIKESDSPDVVSQKFDDFYNRMKTLEAQHKTMRKRGSQHIGYPATNSQKHQHIVTCKMNGKEYVLYVNGNPRFAQAINGELSRNAADASQESQSFFAGVSRWMANNFTSRNPAFIISNAARDMQMAMQVMGIKEGAAYQARLGANISKLLFPKMKKKGFALMPDLMKKFNDGTLGTAGVEKYFREFMERGAETGFTSLKDIDQMKDDIARLTRHDKQGILNTSRAVRALGDTFEYYNRCVEDLSRFAVYMTSRQRGKSIAQSIDDAKNCTLNFNRKGSGAMGNATFRHLYIFVNPAIQALNMMFDMAKKHPFRLTATLAGNLIAGAVIPVVNTMCMAALGGDDDDYWNLPVWERRNNIVIWVPGTKRFVTIPLPQEMRCFYGLGEAAVSCMMGHGGEHPAMEVAEQFLDLLPISFTGAGGNMLINLSPTMLQPLMQVYANTDFTGKPIFRDNEGSKYEPLFQKAYSGTPSWMVKTSKIVNDLTGGDTHEQGWYERTMFGKWANNPAIVNHLMKGYYGGVYSFISGVAGMLTTAAGGEVPKTYEIPIVNRFVKDPSERNSAMLPDWYWDIVEKRDRYRSEIRSWKNDAKKGDEYAFGKLKDKYQGIDYYRYQMRDAYIKQIDELRKYHKAAVDEETMKSCEEYIRNMSEQLRKIDGLNDEEFTKLCNTSGEEFNELMQLSQNELKKRLK